MFKYSVNFLFKLNFLVEMVNFIFCQRLLGVTNRVTDGLFIDSLLISSQSVFQFCPSYDTNDFIR